MLRRAALTGFICCVALAQPAFAIDPQVRVQEQVLQKGLFANPECKPDPEDEGYDACMCESDIRYPEIAGLQNIQIQATLNAAFREDAEKAKCPGAAAKDAGKKDHASASHHYEVTFLSPKIAGIEFTDWGFTGGAHGNGSVRGVILDLDKGKALAIGELIADKDMADVNTVIYNALINRPGEEAFRDQVEAGKGKFVTAAGCKGCTLILKPDGLHVLFQTYEVASFAEGNTDVPIPVKYVIYPPIMQALAEQKPTPPEKK